MFVFRVVGMEVVALGIDAGLVAAALPVLLLDQEPAASGTDGAGGLEVRHEITGGVVRAAVELLAPPALLPPRNDLARAARPRAVRQGDRPGRSAFGEAGAGQEEPVAPQLLHHRPAAG